MSLKPLEVQVPITELPTLAEKKSKQTDLNNTRTVVITHNWPTLIFPTFPGCKYGGDSCCSENGDDKCGYGEGDCDSDDECAGSLVCGSSNCRDLGLGFSDRFDSTDDCCV